MKNVLTKVARLLRKNARYRRRTRFDIHLTYPTPEEGRETIALLLQKLGSQAEIIRSSERATLAGVRASEQALRKALAHLDPKRVHASYERSPTHRKASNASERHRIIHTD